MDQNYAEKLVKQSLVKPLVTTYHSINEFENVISISVDCSLNIYTVHLSIHYMDF